MTDVTGRKGDSLRGFSPRPDRGSVAVQDLGLVLVPRGGGAVGVQDQGPAPPVDRDLVVEASTAARSPWCWSCRRWPCASCGAPRTPTRAGCSRRPTGTCGPAAPPRCGSRRDRLAVPDIERQARPAQAYAELPRRRKLASPPGPDSRSTALPMTACSRASQAVASAGRRRGGGRPARRTAGPGLPARHVHVAGDDRGHRGIADDGLGGVAVQPGAALAAGLGRNARRAAPAPGPARSTAPAGRSRRPQQQVGQRDCPTPSPAARPAHIALPVWHTYVDRLPAPFCEPALSSSMIWSGEGPGPRLSGAGAPHLIGRQACGCSCGR